MPAVQAVTTWTLALHAGILQITEMRMLSLMERKQREFEHLMISGMEQ